MSVTTWRASVKGRSALLIVVIGTVALLAAVLAGAQLAIRRTAPKLTGTVLGKEAAPGFLLRDSGGQAYSLAQFRGKVVVLTFFYTHCPDECPLTAEIERHADEAAGHPQNVVYLAVSVDPNGDTPESIGSFTREHHLDELGDRWHYLIGSLPELQSVWKSYYIYASTDPSAASTSHTTGLYFIDQRGDRRLYTSLPVTAEEVARNEEILLGQ